MTARFNMTPISSPCHLSHAANQWRPAGFSLTQTLIPSLQDAQQINNINNFLSGLQAGKSGEGWTWMSLISWTNYRLESLEKVEPGCRWFPERITGWKVWRRLNLDAVDFLKVTGWKVWVKWNLVGCHWLGAGLAHVTSLFLLLCYTVITIITMDN